MVIDKMLKIVMIFVLSLSMAQKLIRKSSTGRIKKPNIVFILADDMGYNDVGYHNSDIKSPNIDQLARSGIQLEQNYVQPQCTPSRAALLTGMYPYHIGRQAGIIQPNGNPDSVNAYLIFYV